MHDNEIRSSDQPVKTTNNRVSGYAIRFDQPGRVSERGRTFVEVVKPGAIKVADNIALFWDHKYDYPLADTRTGTLTYQIDHNGLYFDAELPETGSEKEKACLTRGTVKGMSFGFAPKVKEKWVNGVRELHEIEVRELSITAHPAYASTSVSMRSTNQMRLELAEKEILED